MAALDNDSDSELELEEKQFTIGAHTFQVHVVGELPLETLFALESKRDEISGQRAWPGSLLLAAEISARPALVEDRAVVELGAGAGLCAMVAARCGARSTTATDGDDRCLDLLRRNVAANGLDGVVSVAKCFWGRDAPPVGDVVLAGDVLYCVEINQNVGCTDNSSLSHFSVITRPSWLGQAARNRHRHAIEQAARDGVEDDAKIQHERAVKF